MNLLHMNNISHCFFFFFIGNAELTNLFKCKKQGHQCCAPKSLIREINGGNSSEAILTNRNDTMYVTSRPYTTPYTTAICKLYINNIQVKDLFKIFARAVFNLSCNFERFRTTYYSIQRCIYP